MTRKLTQGAICGVFLIWAGVATNATVYTFLPETGEWRVPGNWSPQATPHYGDTAIIPTGKTCVVIGSEGSIGELIIQSGAMVRVV